MIVLNKRQLVFGIFAGLALGKARAEVNQSAANAPRIGIALGAGGASGLAHIPMLQVLDEMNIRPYAIAGSSIGAIIGSLFAAGLTASRIRQLVERLMVSKDARLFDRLFKVGPLRMAGFVRLDPRDGGLLNSAGFLSLVADNIKASQIEELEIPIAIVAADLWKREAVVLRSGPLIPAISASMALPGVFKPVTIDGRVLIDGGTVNPVPYDVLSPGCDIVIAIDVIGQRSRPAGRSANYFDTVFLATKVMQSAIMTEKRKVLEPDIYIAPQVTDVRALEFHRAEAIFEHAEPSKEVLRSALHKALAAYSASKR